MRSWRGALSLIKNLDLWGYMNVVTLDFIRPGMLTDNAFIEPFNSKFKIECLNTSWFLSLDEARSKCEACGRTIMRSDRTVQSATNPRLSSLAPHLT